MYRSQTEHTSAYRQAGKLAELPDGIGFLVYYVKETIWDQFLIFFKGA